jgi:hypothetical protein
MTTKPTWGTLYGIGMIGIGSLFCVPLLHVAALAQTLMFLLIVAALYGAIGMWISANSTALENEDVSRMNAKFKIHWDVARRPAPPEIPIPDIETPQPHDHHEH